MDIEGGKVCLRRGLEAQQGDHCAVLREVEGVLVRLKGGVIIGGDDAVHFQSAEEVVAERDGGGDGELFDVAFGEHAVAEGELLCALRKGDGEFAVGRAAARERVISDLRHARGDGERFDLFAAIEGVVAHFGDGAVLRKGDLFQVGAFIEGVIADRSSAERSFLPRKGERGERAARKGEVAHRLHGCGDDDVIAAEADDAEEGARRDGGSRLGDGVAGNALIRGEVEEGVAHKQDAVHRAVGRLLALRHFDAGEVGAAEEGVGRGRRQVSEVVERRGGSVVLLIRDAREPCGQADGGEVRVVAVLEGAVADGEGGRARAEVLKDDARKVGAVRKRLRSDGGDACGDDDALDAAARKRACRDGRHAVGDAVASRLSRGHERGLRRVGRVLRAHVVEHAVLRGVARIRGACRIHVDVGERGAPFKGARGDVRHGVGDVNGGEGGEACKRAACDLRHRSALVLRGDGDGGNEVCARPCTDGIAVAHPGEGEHVLHPEGVERGVLGELPDGEGLAVCVGVLLAHAVRRAEPAAERARAVRRLGHGKGVFLSVVDGGFRQPVRAAQRHFDRLGRVACVERQPARSNIAGVFIPCAQPFGTVGRGVPRVEVVACGRGGGGQPDKVARRRIHGAHGAAALAAVKGDGIRLHRERRPFGGAVLAQEAHFQRVLARTGEDGAAGGALHAEEGGVVAVHAHFVAERARNGLPGEGALRIGENGVEVVKTEGVRLARGKGVAHRRLELHGVVIAHRPAEQRRKVVGRLALRNGCLLPVIENGIGDAFLALPREDGAVEQQLFGQDGRRLLMGEGEGGGGVVAARRGLHREGVFPCGKVLEGVLRSRDGEGGGPHRHTVERGARHGVPGEDVVLHLEVLNGVQRAFQHKFRLGGGIAFRRRLDGEADAALLHCTVGEVVVERSAQIELIMNVPVVAAVDGEEVLLRPLHAAEHERVGRDDLNARDAGECLAHKVALRRRAGDDAAARRRGGDFHAVCARIRQFCREGGARRGPRVGDGGAVGCDDGHKVTAHPVDGVPGDGVLGDGDLGRGRLGVRRLPHGKQRGVGVEHGVLRKAEGEAVRLVLHAHPPARKVVALARGNGRVVELLADGRRGGGRLRLIAEVVRHGVFHAVGRGLCPARIQRRVGGHRIRKVGRSVLRVLVPADKGISVAHGIGGELRRLSVERLHARGVAAALCVERDGVIDFLVKAHLRVAVVEGEDVPLQRRRIRLVARVERERLVLKGIPPARDVALHGEGELHLAAQREQILLAAGVVVVCARFRARLRGGSVLARRQNGGEQAAYEGGGDGKDAEAPSLDVFHIRTPYFCAAVRFAAAPAQRGAAAAALALHHAGSVFPLPI